MPAPVRDRWAWEVAAEAGTAEEWCPWLTGSVLAPAGRSVPLRDGWAAETRAVRSLVTCSSSSGKDAIRAAIMANELFRTSYAPPSAQTRSRVPARSRHCPRPPVVGSSTVILTGNYGSTSSAGATPLHFSFGDAREVISP